MAEATLEEGRGLLLAWLNASAPQGSSRNAVTVVFDGNAEHFSAPATGAAKVVFTRGESADDYIKRVVERSADKKKFVVVSDDKGIKLYVRALGAGVLSVREFAAGLFKSAGAKTDTSKGGRRGDGGKYVSLTQAQKINKELEKLWLK